MSKSDDESLGAEDEIPSDNKTNNLPSNYGLNNADYGVSMTNSDDNCCTYQFDCEEHTFGNLIRYGLLRHPNVEMAGYSIPHPSEDIVNVRLQLHKESDKGTNEVFMESLATLHGLVGFIGDKFDKALDKYEKNTMKDSQ
eukprot:Mrub_13420.p1 GENE.Mrub_13420~~Mrub_13420.p1  ORF type:complete len:140 (-),score=22.53 Mrub_13420:21-440(-)